MPARHDTPAGKKWCPYCERFRAKVDFQVNRSRADKLQPRCRDCHNATRTAETRQRLAADEYAAHLRLTEAHPEEWQRYLTEARQAASSAASAATPGASAGGGVRK